MSAWLKLADLGDLAGLNADWRQSAEAATTGRTSRQTVASAANAESESLWLDRVELSDGEKTSASSGNLQLTRFGSYKLVLSGSSGTLNAASPLIIPNNRDAQDLLGSIAGRFGANSLLTRQASSDLARLDELSDSPEYAKLLVLLKTLGERDPAAAQRMLRSFSRLMDGLGAATPQVTSPTGSAARSIFAVNMEASATAINGPAGTTLAASFSASAQFTLTRSTSSLSLSVSANLEIGNASLQAGAPAQGDPLVLDLAGDGINLRSAETGVDFDLTGDGQAERTAFIQNDDAFLFLDQNGNGVADHGGELFGDQEGHANGFAELAEHDENGDHLIDANDSVYSRLRLFQDLNGDGINQAEETLSLAEAGISAIRVGYERVNEDDGQGNTIAEKSSFIRSDGTSGLVVDALLKFYP